MKMLNKLFSLKLAKVSWYKHALKQFTRSISSSKYINQFVKRTHSCGQLNSDHVNQDVILCGWIQFKRMNKFIVLRDSYGCTQLLIQDKQLQKLMKNLGPESVIQVTGKVLPRPSKEINLAMTTGKIEVEVNDLVVLNKCADDIPFIVRDYQDVNEKLRLNHRYIDLRNPKMQYNLRLRSQVIMKMRQFLHDFGFVEVETPTMFKRTPGGAKEFIVPSHQEPDKFYSLTQSPQQFKQLLMMGAIDRYFQIARCYRDEGTKSDRQPEFTQLDLEMSFTSVDGIIKLIEELIAYSWPENVAGKITIPFPRMKYHDAIHIYGNDKPDLRIKKVNDGDGDKDGTGDRDGTGAEMIDNKNPAFVWIVDFPLFVTKKSDDNENMTKIQSAHHPFTAPKSIEDIYSNPLSAVSQQFDLVLNGNEIGGGSIRIHDALVQEYVLKKILKEETDEMDYFLQAMKHGCPPHGGIAIGLDRLFAMICNANSIRDVIAFPKSSGGKCLMSGAPTHISNQVKYYYNIESIIKEKTSEFNQEGEAKINEEI